MNNNKDIDAAMHLALCVHKIEKLYLVECTVTEQGCTALIDRIRQFSKPVNFFDVIFESMQIRNVDHKQKLLFIYTFFSSTNF